MKACGKPISNTSIRMTVTCAEAVGHSGECVNVDSYGVMRRAPVRNSKMDDATFRALLDLLMCSDQLTTQDYESYKLLAEFADNESRARGYDGWIVAYRKLKSQEAGGYALAVRGSRFTPESVVTIDGEVVSDNCVTFVSSHELWVYVRDEAAGKAVERLAVDGERVPFGGKS